MKFRLSVALLVGSFAAVSLLLLPLSQLAAQDDTRRLRVQPRPESDKRLALVIGNRAYKDSPLLNPVNDARAMAQALRSFGFEVIYGENLSQNEMKRNVRAFGEKLRNGGAGLFYYAGHGVQVKGSNYLIPVDATINSEEEIEYESVDLGLVLAQMETAHNRLNILILDACRNNPFARSVRSSQKGLASIDAPSGTLIAYATAPGSVASDGGGKNGLYTQELLKNMRIPALSIEQVFKRVRVAVREQTRGAQTPWESSSLVGDFYFAGTAATANTAPTANPVSPPSQPVSAETYIQKGDTLAEQNKWNLAEEAYQLGLAWEPDNPWYRFKLYTAISMQNKVEQASAQYRILERQNKWAEIETEARRLVKQNPASALYHWQLGTALTRLEKYAEAEAELRKAISLEPDRPIWHNSLSITLRQQKKFSEAQAEVRKAINLEPNNARWHGSLAFTFYAQQKYAEADAELRKAINLEPNISEYYGSLGASLFNQQRFVEAEAELRKAITIAPGVAEYHYNLGAVLWRQNKYAEAEKELREAIRLEPDDKRYQETLDQVKKH